ncbi:RNA 2',3'-cyclic phosphodiesterase [Cytobacillus gottheilii]|uniref:RNA 2',3'-cyclic phosphodiesterase n=1 Tax=Cytobacillus gottheilii TaxID=859144 RepID=UPI002148E8C6|nr:RNA 2',3'-cyclic phosphodiesterase [Cytobacillus gottheilii]
MGNEHYFFALSLPEEVKKEMWSYFEAYKVTLPFKTWVHQEDYHITLAFLGGAEKTMLEDAISLVRSSMQHEEIRSFSIHINKLDVFGQADSPRIFWAGLKESPPLHKVRKRVYDACLKAGFRLETRSFKPHITVARRWQAESAYSAALLEPKEWMFMAKEIVLYKTHMHKTPKYERIAIFPLR